jgi:putative transposase
MSLDDARIKLEDWRRDYNEIRPHSSIGNKAPILLMKGSSALPQL